MDHKGNDFPQYRKLSNERAFYRIEGQNSFTEVQLIGSRKIIHTIIAQQYPEKLRIMDMLKNLDPFVGSDKEEFERHFES